MGDLTKVALAIVSLALAATLVVNYKGTTAVINSAAGGFQKSISAAQKG